ncbi:DUF4097 family beta strand repeat-containing protein [Bacillus methanolicus]|uniref:Uncharacterized protein n=1 Tax=Bacillus methanolicus (strain MGA3 / ATCC 53907) TaxID=796606 RepID=I3DU73_BACMM|nr:DUF4097 domain-containing protein [Bacillus methanolicus]AIE61320.1 hypothetical protein BMMGA3_14815 [Bacillus methanolicus MGA3]EIJ77794.1 hypothetical protein MGA3_15626 [Bacillus methanolicus MGA3]
MLEERKRILNMVKEGKLTVDEALTLLEELEKSSKTMEQKQEEIIHDLSTAVNFEEAKKEDNVHYKFQSVKDKIFDFVDSALKKMKEFDLDLNFGQSIEVSHIFQHGDANVKEIDVDVANGSVKLVPWDQRDVRVECNAKVYRVHSQEEARQSFLKDVVFGIEGEKMRFGTQQKWMKVDAKIYVPQEFYEYVRVRMFNGPIEGKNIKANNLKVKAANGKINLDSIISGKTEVETANGHIHLSNCTADDLELESINGAIELDGDVARADVQTFNGNVHCTLKNRAESIVAKATTGSIEIFLPESVSAEGDLKTNLGGFSVELEGIQIVEEKSEMIQKMLRFKPLHDEKKVVKVFADSKTGSIHIKKRES